MTHQPPPISKGKTFKITKFFQRIWKWYLCEKYLYDMKNLFVRSLGFHQVETKRGNGVSLVKEYSNFRVFAYIYKDCGECMCSIKLGRGRVWASALDFGLYAFGSNEDELVHVVSELVNYARNPEAGIAKLQKKERALDIDGLYYKAIKVLKEIMA